MGPAIGCRPSEVEFAEAGSSASAKPASGKQNQKEQCQSSSRAQGSKEQASFRCA